MNLDHKHLLLRAEVNNCPSEPQLSLVLAWMKKLIKSIDMNLLQGPNIAYIDQPGNRGITCMALIETSHIVLHIWDEQDPGIFQLDVYSCKSFDVNIVVDCLKNDFDVAKIEYKYLDRNHGLALIDEK
tara:strand:+ start:145 stop:528 length:384 start_codon:yes stop_codon:yes gene_type:complete